MVACALPSLISFVILCFLPESPKFILGQGKQSEAYQILQKMNRINNGKSAKFETFEIYEETESIENQQQDLICRNGRFAFITSAWNRTVPLFKPPHLFATILICILQFTAYTTTNGFYMFTADILNKMANNLNDFTNQREMMCDVISMKTIQNNGTSDERQFHSVSMSMKLEQMYNFCVWFSYQLN